MKLIKLKTLTEIDLPEKVTQFTALWNPEEEVWEISYPVRS